MRGVATVLLMDGKPVFACQKCGRVLAGNRVTVVTAERRKNRLGRIAWSRDGICAECAEKEGAWNHDRN